ncbi:hypothetical protein HYX12_01530 [Candidatus Woesearchaeota archaeon]|nr:hypothetical protein [Candidatus Woesearchaeota archaeon]
MTITGTINSGGIIGPVGGVKEKLIAASQNGLKKVLVASGTKEQLAADNSLNNKEMVGDNLTNTANNEATNSSNPLIQPNSIVLPTKLNQSLNDTESSRNKPNTINNLEIIEVINLDEVISQFSGVDLNHKELNITVDKEYSKIMQSLQMLLCSRTEQLEKELREERIIVPSNLTEEIEKKKKAAFNATASEDYYSAASMCFSNNINLKEEFYKQKKLSPGAYQRLFNIIELKINALKNRLNNETINTISDLQASMIVKERISDAEKQIEQFYTKPESRDTVFSTLAYAKERYFSAVSWMEFLDMPGKKFIFNPENIKESCMEKISESEERHQYATLYLGETNLLSIREKIDSARKALSETEPALCLIMASQAKAEANAILSSMGLEEKDLDKFLQSKQKAVERVIAENSAEGIFPILGYSYYRYSQAQEQNKFHSLLYLEYALEMSDLQMYFPEEKTFLGRVKDIQLEEKWIYLLIGISTGLSLMWLVTRK